jgi:Mrp family chromosome partitioning ATPase
LYSYLAAVRAEFEYSIVLANPADSSAMLEAARFSDGLVLVLSAVHTRRRAALQTKRALEQAGVKLLGTVLADREFPIPHNLYRRL